METKMTKQEAMKEIEGKMAEIREKFREAIELAKANDVEFTASISEMLNDGGYLDAHFDPTYGWDTYGWSTSNC